MPILAAFALATMLAQAPSPAASAGDAAFQRGDFQTAFREYNDAIIRDPSDEDAILGLGTLDLYRNDWSNARTYLERARHLSPGDPRVETRLAVLEQRLPKPPQYAFVLQNGQTDVPFTSIDPVPLVKATVNGRTLTFAVDTSAGSVDLSNAAAQALGIPDGGTLASVALPGLTVTNVPAAISQRVLPAGADGALGTVFLSHFLPTFDYAHNRLTLRRWEASPALERTAAAAGAAIEPMWLVGDRLLVANGRIDGDPPMLFAIQTGSAGGAVALAHTEGSTMPLVSLGKYAQGPLQAATLPELAFESVPFHVGGAFRNPFFRPATLTLDFAAMKIVVSK